MNRIVLIGNGFDLAHNLPTSYKDFIEYYWGEWACKVNYSCKQTEDDQLINLQFPGNHLTYRYNISKIWKSLQDANDELKFSNIKLNFISQFFASINRAVETYNWVDIENEYYDLLKQISKKEYTNYSDPHKLNNEFDILGNKLFEYLCTINDNIKDDIINPEIKKKIFGPFKTQDLAYNRIDSLQQLVQQRIHDVFNDQSAVRSLLRSYGYDVDYVMREIEILTNNSIDFISAILTGQIINPYYLLPDNILLLNFNYTSTASRYISSNKPNIIDIHIHGELDNEQNKPIFGYGDELDESYKYILDLNDNAYLKNIKSIHYLETDNYRKLLNFVNSAPFQIYIMGHSCGNSDRTLLNTLFEHDNCISIKPFYHRLDDNNDNYCEIIQNISRNFNDMQLMRSRVVNKSYCDPLT